MFWSIKEKAQNLGNIAKFIAKEIVQDEHTHHDHRHYLDVDTLALNILDLLLTPIRNTVTQQITNHFLLLSVYP